MADTGLFLLSDVFGQEDEAGRLLQVTQVVCRCLECSCHFTARPNEGLIDLDGGAILACPMCPNRQAISMARFADFLQLRL
ncbi:MAG TPA: hypothetical protein DIW85_11660 [Stenotrophomonas sp.]|jgi:hypothetical protein|nr:hypothetical protein [Stenotrophomonas sp.]